MRMNLKYYWNLLKLDSDQDVEILKLTPTSCSHWKYREEVEILKQL